MLDSFMHSEADKYLVSSFGLALLVLELIIITFKAGFYDPNAEGVTD
jgi:hypothetical protein